MSAPLKGCCFVEDQQIPFHFDNWLPYEIPPVLIGVNPHLSLLGSLTVPGRTSWSYNWHYNGAVFKMCFTPPKGVCVQPINQWKSISPGSSSLYPWWCTLKGANGTPPVDLICQIHPLGVSSEHKHAREVGIAVAEEYGPVWNDGKTMLRIEDEEPKSLLSPQRIFPEQRHQLIREAPGFSVHLLIMRSRIYRFPNRDGHISCTRLHNNASTP